MTVAEPVALAHARRIYRQRRIRDAAFGEEAQLFGDPAYDILLDLFIAHEEGRVVPATSASIAACAPPTTALRWIQLLVTKGLVMRGEDSGDRRRVLVSLTPRAVTMLRTALTRMDAARS